jgi:catechol 2,3-dioxygenase-like lactoylglutathione lyase family enzyme
MSEPLFLNIDCLGVQVSNLEEALRFYRDELGHRLVWRTETSAGLAFRDAVRVPELVLHVDPWAIAAAIQVESVPEAVERFRKAGGTLVDGPSDIPIGQLAVVSDPWHNHLVLLDTSKGSYETDAQGNVTGIGPGT